MSQIVLLALIAWLIPLASFLVILLFGPRLGRFGRSAGYLATGAIVASFLCVGVAAVFWFWHFPVRISYHAEEEIHSHLLETGRSVPLSRSAVGIESRNFHRSIGGAFPAKTIWAATVGSDLPAQADSWRVIALKSAVAIPPKDGSAKNHQDGTSRAAAIGEHTFPPVLTGDWLTLAEFGHLRLTVGYYIDALTLIMMIMVTLVASCIHLYSLGYMAEELQEEVIDLEAPRQPTGDPLRRRGRFHRFYQYLSLFCFSMLGLILANNLFMIFVFWELVGICSYLLIGFYLERPAAVRAATKAFVVNRVGDFGMLIGLAIFWGTCGTLHFGPSAGQPGIFSQAERVLRPQPSSPTPGTGRGQELPRGSQPLVDVAFVGASGNGSSIHSGDETVGPQRGRQLTYGLLVLAGLALFCGCVGKSAQFPLHVWLPDAMEGPTPVSALIHAATMVAAGVYLVGRFYPAFAPEVLLVVALIGAISLLLAGTMALVASEVKRVLAYSTISQLGYMMFGLGIGGWAAGLFHLITHAFFKALLFLAAGSVIHAVHTGELSRMGGLWRKLPWTAGTMLVGCLAILGAGIPPWIGLSGFHSKDAILAQAYLLSQRHGGLATVLLAVALLGTTLTGLYMFRLWFLTFAGRPRDPESYHHAHESPPVMVLPLAILAFLAVVAGWHVPGTNWGIISILDQARATAVNPPAGQVLDWWQLPPEHDSHSPAIHVPTSWLAFLCAAIGFLAAVIFYGLRWFDAAVVARKLWAFYHLCRRRYFLDDLYEKGFVPLALAVARVAAWVDKSIIDRLLDGMARGVTAFAFAGDHFDRRVVDGAFHQLGQSIYGLGTRIRKIQTGLLRQYLLAILTGVIILLFLAQWF